MTLSIGNENSYVPNNQSIFLIEEVTNRANYAVFGKILKMKIIK